MEDRKITFAKSNPSPKIHSIQFRMTKADRETMEGKAYRSMMSRNTKSYKAKHPAYKNIDISDRWLHLTDGFQNFLNDMGSMPDTEHRWSIDRIDNSKGYSKDNCRWATYKSQANNKTNNRYINYKGETKTLTEWAETQGISVGTLHWRMKHGWSFEEALFTPIGYVK